MLDGNRHHISRLQSSSSAPFELCLLSNSATPTSVTSYGFKTNSIRVPGKLNPQCRPHNSSVTSRPAIPDPTTAAHDFNKIRAEIEYQCKTRSGTEDRQGRIESIQECRRRSSRFEEWINCIECRIWSLRDSW